MFFSKISIYQSTLQFRFSLFSLFLFCMLVVITLRLKGDMNAGYNPQLLCLHIYLADRRPKSIFKGRQAPGNFSPGSSIVKERCNVM